MVTSQAALAEPVVFNTEPPPEPIVTRFLPSDIPKWGEFLTGKLRTKWPDLNERTYLGILQGYMQSNEFLFIKTEGALGLAVVCTDPLEFKPIVREIFVFGREDVDRQCTKIYREFKRWALSMNATRVEVGIFSDITPGKLRQFVSGVESRTTIIKLERT